MAEEAGTEKQLAAAARRMDATDAGTEADTAPRDSGTWRASGLPSPAVPLEGALVGYRPLLYPVPVGLFFASVLFWATSVAPTNVVIVQ